MAARRTLTAANLSTDRVYLDWSAATSSYLHFVSVSGLGASPKLHTFGSKDSATTTRTDLRVSAIDLTFASPEIALAFVVAPTVNVSNPTWAAAGPAVEPLLYWTRPLPPNAFPGCLAWQVTPEARSHASVKWTPPVTEPQTGFIATYSA